jgi:hypothetical protein
MSNSGKTRRKKNKVKMKKRTNKKNHNFTLKKSHKNKTTRRNLKGGNTLLDFNLTEYLNELFLQNKIGSCPVWDLPTNMECKQIHGKFLTGYDQSLEMYRNLHRGELLKYMSMTIKEQELNIPKMPKYNCSQVVLGTMEDLTKYIAYNNTKLENNEKIPFSILQTADWDEKTNIAYIYCAFYGQLGNSDCKYPIRILLPKDMNRLINKQGDARVTLKELCFVDKLVNKTDQIIKILTTDDSYDYNILFV